MCLKRQTVFDFAVQRGVTSLTSDDVLRCLVKNFNQYASASLSHIKKLVSSLKKKWAVAHRRKDRFRRANTAWLRGSICLPRLICRRSRGGRPPAQFDDLSRASKLRFTRDLRQQSSREPVFAAASPTYQEGRRSAGRLVEAAGSPMRGPPLTAALSAGPSTPQHPYTCEEALALLVDLGLTKAQYINIQ